jgi:hypothetical protein
MKRELVTGKERGRERKNSSASPPPGHGYLVAPIGAKMATTNALPRVPTMVKA